MKPKMKLRPWLRLEIRLALAVNALVTALLAGGLYVLSAHHFERMVESRRQAAELQNRLLEAALRHQMLEQRAKGPLLQAVLREVSSQPEVRGVMILDHRGVVRQSSRPEMIGQAFPRESEACMVCHRKAPAERGRWAVVELPGGEVLRSVQPIENRRECHRCHDARERLNGILILDVSLRGLHAQLAQDRRWMIGGTAALGVLMLVSIGAIVRRLVLTRLRSLGETARAIASGRLEQRAEVRGDDTIAALATDFNNMADAVLNLLSEVESREAQLVNVINSVDDGIVVLDRELRVVAANQAFCRRFGLHAETLRGQRCQEALRDSLHCEAGDVACPSVRCLQDGEIHRATLRFAGGNGEPTRIEEVHASPVLDAEGQLCQVVEVWRDITERLAEETRLAELERLESLGALASGFSHEVNTPLATILTCAEAILSRVPLAEAEGGAQSTATAEIREMAETIRSQVLRCRRVTEQFLRFARGIPPTAEPVDLRDALASVTALVAPAARHAGVAIRTEMPPKIPPVHANAEAVQHVLLNLLVNGIQSFEGKSGVIAVSVEAGSDVRVRIRDHGRGVPREARAHLFEPFRSTRSGGTGIGLFLSRAIVRRFGGDLRLAWSEEGVGSCFEVILRRA